MPTITSDLMHRARGSLLGAVVGDAFAMPLEGVPPQPIANQLREMRAGRLEAGHFTAATARMLTTAHSLLDPQAPEVEAIAPAWHRGAHSPTGRFSALLARFTHQPQTALLPSEVTEPDPAVLTRCLPLPLAYIGDRQACLEQARRRTALTHTHPDCLAGSAFVAALLWYILRGLAPGKALQQALNGCGEMPDALRETIQNAPGRLRRFLTNGPTVQETLECVTWGFITTASYAEAVTRVANLGGPSAPVSGAIVGALAGAAYRLSGIPADWRALVHGTWPARSGRTWHDSVLTELGERLVQQS